LAAQLIPTLLSITFDSELAANNQVLERATEALLVLHAQSLPRGGGKGRNNASTKQREQSADEKEGDMVAEMAAFNQRMNAKYASKANQEKLKTAAAAAGAATTADGSAASTAAPKASQESAGFSSEAVGHPLFVFMCRMVATMHQTLDHMQFAQDAQQQQQQQAKQRSGWGGFEEELQPLPLDDTLGFANALGHRLRSAHYIVLRCLLRLPTLETLAAVAIPVNALLALAERLGRYHVTLNTFRALHLSSSQLPSLGLAALESSVTTMALRTIAALVRVMQRRSLPYLPTIATVLLDVVRRNGLDHRLLAFPRPSLLVLAYQTARLVVAALGVMSYTPLLKPLLAIALQHAALPIVAHKHQQHVRK
jgi:hypothetical protein